MKKLFFLAGFIFFAQLPSAFAQLVGVDRVQNHQWMVDDKQLRFGSFPDAACEYDTTQTNDALVCGLSSDSERLILTQNADLGTNFGLSDLNTPGLTIMSADGTRNVTLYHDGTNAVIDVSSGTVSFPDGILAGLNVLVQEDLTATCTLGQLKLDTGGATIELCYCRATNTWACTPMAAGPTD